MLIHSPSNNSGNTTTDICTSIKEVKIWPHMRERQHKKPAISIAKAVTPWFTSRKDTRFRSAPMDTRHSTLERVSLKTRNAIKPIGNLKRHWNTAAQQSRHQYRAGIFVLLEQTFEGARTSVDRIHSITKQYVCSPVPRDATSASLAPAAPLVLASLFLRTGALRQG